MKRSAAVLAGLLAACMTVGAVYADDLPVSVSLAEPGALEDPDHPFLFGRRSVWELEIAKLQAPGQSESFLSADQLAGLIKKGVLRVRAETEEGADLLERHPIISREDSRAVLKLDAGHSYGTAEEELQLRFSFTLLRNLYWDKSKKEYTPSPYNAAGEQNALILEKGNVLLSQAVDFTAHYDRVEDYQSTILLNEDTNNSGAVLADGEGMYMAAGPERMLTIDFDGIVSYSTCISAAQKTVNLYYALDEIPELMEACPDVTFRFISFPGNPSFVNSGELAFQTLDKEMTAVYQYKDGELIPLESEYDELADRVVVRGVKRLESYVIASQSVGNLVVQTEDGTIRVRQ